MRWSVESVKKFYLADFESGFFPLETSRFLIQRAGDRVLRSARRNQGPLSLLSQHPIEPSRLGGGYRTTVKLDPVTEIYLYDFIYRNRSLFTSRNGIGFGRAGLTTVELAFSKFHRLNMRAVTRYRFLSSGDIATFFDNIRPSELLKWLRSLGVSRSDLTNLQIFFDSTQVEGRTGLVKGPYPAKVLADHYLASLTSEVGPRSEVSSRFLDEYWFFSNHRNKIDEDLLNLSAALEEKGFRLNSSKTFDGPTGNIDNSLALTNGADNRLRYLIRASAYCRSRGFYHKSIDGKMIEDIVSLAVKDDAEEQVVDLAFCIAPNHPKLMNQLQRFLYQFPSVARRLTLSIQPVVCIEHIASSVIAVLWKNDQRDLTESHLFWLAGLVERHLLHAERAGEILSRLISHENSTAITKARVLEIAGDSFELPDIRKMYLKSDWPWCRWAAAIGSRMASIKEKTARLGHFKVGSEFDALVKETVLEAA